MNGARGFLNRLHRVNDLKQLELEKTELEGVASPIDVAGFALTERRSVFSKP